MTAADRTPDRSPCPGAEQAAADRALARIIWVRAARQCRYQSRGNYAASDQPLHRSILLKTALGHLAVSIGQESYRSSVMGNASA